MQTSLESIKAYGQALANSIEELLPNCTLFSHTETLSLPFAQTFMQVGIDMKDIDTPVKVITAHLVEHIKIKAGETLLIKELPLVENCLSFLFQAGNISIRALVNHDNTYQIDILFCQKEPF